MPTKRELILGLASGEAKVVSNVVSDNLKTSMMALLRNSLPSVPFLSMRFTGTGPVVNQAVFLNNDLNGFIWGFHTWGIHKISDRSYNKPIEIPIDSIWKVIS